MTEAGTYLVTESIVSFVARAMVTAGVPEAPVQAYLDELGIVGEGGSARVAWHAYRELWVRAESLMPVPDLGLRVAVAIPFGARELVDFLLRSASNLREVVELSLELAPLMDNSLRGAAEIVGPSVFFRITRAPGLVVPPAMSDYATARLLGSLHDLTGEPLVPERVFMTRSRPEDDAAHRAHYGCPLSFEQSFDGMQAPLAWGERPLPARDGALHSTLLRHMRRDLGEPASEPESWAAHVRALMTQLIAEGQDVQQSVVARRLGQSPRTLRRLLAVESTSYAELYDRVRLEHAQTALHAGCSIEEVAQQLGFASPGSFSRTFRRWVGMPPERWRRTSR